MFREFEKNRNKDYNIGLYFFLSFFKHPEFHFIKAYTTRYLVLPPLHSPHHLSINSSVLSPSPILPNHTPSSPLTPRNLTLSTITMIKRLMVFCLHFGPILHKPIRSPITQETQSAMKGNNLITLCQQLTFSTTAKFVLLLVIVQEIE